MAAHWVIWIWRCVESFRGTAAADVAIHTAALCACQAAFWRHDFTASGATGEQEADRGRDGKRNKTFECGIVVHHDFSHGVGCETDSVSSYARATCALMGVM